MNVFALGCLPLKKSSFFYNLRNDKLSEFKEEQNHEEKAGKDSL